MSLFQLGDFELSSGKTSPWKIECDSLDDGDIATLAQLIRQLVGPFSSAVGVPRGGLKLAAALRPFESLNGPCLIVDDVLTTGGSISKMRDEIYAVQEISQKERPSYVVGCVVFARGQLPNWCKAVFEMPECFWAKPKTRGA